jgi:multiple sugar transport system permease protein
MTPAEESANPPRPGAAAVARPAPAASGPPGPRHRWFATVEARTRWLGAAMFLPAIVYVLAVIGFPFVLACIYSVTNIKVGSVSYHFVGLANFRSILQSPTFRRSLLNSVVFTVSTQVLVLVGSTILALALKDKFRGRSIFQFLILLPWVAPVSIGAIGWKWLLDSIYSVINWVLIALHLVRPFDAPMWLGTPLLAMISVIGVETWRLLPFATVILLAGLTAIPKDIPEAAAVDGAGFWRSLFQITIPMMLPIITVAVLFGVIFTFTDMTVVYILTRGGPYDTTQVIPTLAFQAGVLGGDLSEGSAISLFLVPILVVVAYFMLHIARRAEVA